MKKSLSEKKVLITGAAGRIGSAITKACIEADANVIITDVSKDGLNYLSDQFDTEREKGYLPSLLILLNLRE